MRLNFEVVHVQHPTPAQFGMFSDPLSGLGSEQPTASLTAPPTLTFYRRHPRFGYPASIPPNGIWYWRLNVPAAQRHRHPELPKELRRSTQTAHRCHALAKARKMCLRVLTREFDYGDWREAVWQARVGTGQRNDAPRKWRELGSPHSAQALRGRPCWTRTHRLPLALPVGSYARTR